ncbi:zinc finger BED domain-containing protein RICESLEEPER 1-like [Gossypium australe]|uniref:Zinc finger BED domain-containing protein RICESLEEPER 1-like n=1 Tax=Gossypium australe TaxID=47621 RepID=A0A5B6VW78_9ROSI|nr:zinc finger BED domain-containing protein RICESLEEPER 1-like [Gossypium australe]
MKNQIWKNTWKLLMYHYVMILISSPARDIISIHVSTVPSEFAFSTSGQVLDPYRSRLLLETVEALMCAQNWIWVDL